MAVVSGTGDGWSSAGVLDGFERACADSFGARCIVSGIDVAPARRVVVSFTVYQVCPPLARHAQKRLDSDGDRCTQRRARTASVSLSGGTRAPSCRPAPALACAQVDGEYAGPTGVYVKMSDTGAFRDAFKSAVERATGALVEQGPTVTSLKVHAGAPPKGRASKLLRKFD